MRASEILRNNVKDRLARGEVVASMTVRLTRGVEIAQLARTAGFDMLYVDLEHSPFSFDTTGQICLASLSAGIAPFVRVPDNRPETISRVLDGGALGVIAPGIGSAEEARAVVAGGEVSAARQARRGRALSAFAISQLPGRGGDGGHQRRHHGDRAV